MATRAARRLAREVGRKVRERRLRRKRALARLKGRVFKEGGTGHPEARKWRRIHQGLSGKRERARHGDRKRRRLREGVTFLGDRYHPSWLKGAKGEALRARYGLPPKYKNARTRDFMNDILGDVE